MVTDLNWTWSELDVHQKQVSTMSTKCMNRKNPFEKKELSHVNSNF